MVFSPSEDILIIKHGALGDIILASGHMKAIRDHHPNARIICLTGKSYHSLLSFCPFVDEVWTDTKPKFFKIGQMLALRRLLRSRPFTRVYDLQTSTRSSSYWYLFGSPKPEWSGIGKFVSHPQLGNERLSMHTRPRLNDQLRIAGIETNGKPEISWLKEDVSALLSRIGPARFALLVPGGSPHRPEKRWPAEAYSTLARCLVIAGITPVLIGGKAEEEVLASIAQFCPEAVNLCAATSIEQIASLARLAVWSVGNDTGPMHLIAAADCPSTVIFSHASTPERSAPQGASVTCLQRDPLATLSADEVWSTRPQGLDS